MTDLNNRIPNGWTCVLLTKVADMIMGQSPDSHYVNEEEIGMPFLQGNAEFSTKYPCPIHWVTKPTKRARKNDILISVRAPVGEINIADQDCCIGRGLAAIRFHEDIDNVFGWYVVGYNKSQLNRFAQGSTFTAISSSDLSHLELKIPERKTEQYKISEILSTLDEAIAQTETLIHKQERIKRGMVSNLLMGGIRVNRELRRTDIGLIPAEWEFTSIGELASYVGSGATPTGGSNVYLTQGILFIRSQNVTFGGLLLDDVAYIDKKIHKNMGRSEIFAHDVLLNITGASIGRCCPFPDGMDDANVNQHVCAIRLPKAKRADAVYLSTVLESHIGQTQIDRLNAGGNRQGLNYQQLRSFLIPWPKEKERGEIAGIIETANASLAAERKTNTKLLQLKQGLMQDLLTGQVRVGRLL